MTKNKTLFLFTEYFPYDSGIDFLDEEIFYLSKHFYKILIIPLHVKQKPICPVPENVIVIDFNLYKPYNRIRCFFNHFSIFINIFCYQFFLSRHKFSYISNFYQEANSLLHKINAAQRLKETIDSKDFKNGVFYSYWFNIWAFLLSVLKSQNKEMKIITRAHGGDLYEERRGPNGYFSFRSFQMRMFNRVAVVSEYGKLYLQNKYPEYKDKIELSRCGVLNQGSNPIPDQSLFRIVSCSSLIPLKRVNLIIEVLMHVRFKVEWVHFGGGELLNPIEEQAKELPSNVTCFFKGHVDKTEIIDFYKNNPVDLFIHLSETEGLPFSIMEAISFGIPVIATDVGGVAEIVNQRTGILIKKDFEPISVTQLITKFHEERNEKFIFREEVKNFWEKNYDAQKNYECFINNILINC